MADWTRIIAGVALLVVMLWAPAVEGQSTLAGLRIPVGAKEAGRSGAAVGAAGEEGAARFNPAATVGGEGIYLEISQVDWFADMGITSGLFAWTAAGGRWTAWVTDIGLGEFERRGTRPTTVPDGAFSASDVEVALSYARPLPVWKGAVGVTIRGMVETIDTDRAVGSDMDLGVIIEEEALGQAVSIGAAARHIGPGFGPGADPLPLTMAAGMRVGVLDKRVSVYADVERVEGVGGGAQLGLEVAAPSSLRLRCGRGIGIDAEGFSAGFDIGVAPGDTEVNVSYAFTELKFDLGPAHRIQLSAGF